VIDGLAADKVRVVLGMPLSDVAVGPGETWIYRAGRCELSLYLFPDVASGGMRVLDHQITGTGPREEDRQACLRQLQHGHGN